MWLKMGVGQLATGQGQVASESKFDARLWEVDQVLPEADVAGGAQRRCAVPVWPGRCVCL